MQKWYNFFILKIILWIRTAYRINILASSHRIEVHFILAFDILNTYPAADIFEIHRLDRKYLELPWLGYPLLKCFDLYRYYFFYKYPLIPKISI